MTPKRKLLISGLALLCVLLGYSRFGPGKYNPVSERAYDIAGAIYSTCNRHDAARLPHVVRLIGTARSESALTADEMAVLQKIVEMAESGNWACATDEARKLLQDQIRSP
jgi:hypothetical protein